MLGNGLLYSKQAEPLILLELTGMIAAKANLDQDQNTLEVFVCVFRDGWGSDPTGSHISQLISKQH